MSSSSSSTRPSSSSSPSKPSSSSSSSSSKPSSSSSSSSSKPSSSSSSSAPPTQPVPHISANAWMSYFLFCCLVLIILQGPLGLTGGGVLPGLTFPSSWTSSSWGGGWGVMPGCAGLVSGVVPWCAATQPQQAAVVSPPMQPSVQVQQVFQQHPPPQQPVGYYTGAPGYPPQAGGYGMQLGGQGGFSTPGGGGGWSWYANGGRGGPQVGPALVRQPAYYVQPQQRTVQVQRPGLQIQVSNSRGEQPVPMTRAFRIRSYLTLTTRVYHTRPTYAYYVHPDGYPSGWPSIYSPNRCTASQPWLCAPFRSVFAYASPDLVVLPHLDGDLRPLGGGGMNIQSQDVGAAPIPVRQHVVPVANVPPPYPPPAIAGLASLENAFYPLLVGAIALLVVFDYAS
ncbi:hypothetical protein IAR55_004329 [Kwoniella newhampshirensis]|uniref:Uncharacterized protein n=1 Tax=Kwoniella newhampshirensis TaxID=1651941 RepID=A0AAW0YXP0_9TREE